MKNHGQIDNIQLQLILKNVAISYLLVIQIINNGHSRHTATLNFRSVSNKYLMVIRTIKNLDLKPFISHTIDSLKS